MLKLNHIAFIFFIFFFIIFSKKYSHIYTDVMPLVCMLNRHKEKIKNKNKNRRKPSIW